MIDMFEVFLTVASGMIIFLGVSMGYFMIQTGRGKI